MTSHRIRAVPRGMAILPIILLVAALSLVAAFAVKVSGMERAEAGKSLHNVSMQAMADTTLQFSKNFFGSRYKPEGQGWTPYLSYFVTNPVRLATRSDLTAYIAALKTARPELFVQLPASIAGSYDCFMYAQDNVDEFAPATNNPNSDNDQLIYV